jgi:hypothetical protein
MDVDQPGGLESVSETNIKGVTTGIPARCIKIVIICKMMYV